MSLFVDYEEAARQKDERNAAEDRERRIQKATLAIQERYGKNALLKGMNFLEGGTTRERNEQIGGHRAGSGDIAAEGGYKGNRPAKDEIPEEGEWDG